MNTANESATSESEWQKARRTLSDETEPRYAAVFSLVEDHLPTLAPEVVKDFENFCADRNRRAIQSAAHQLIAAGDSRVVVHALARELDLATSSLLLSYRVDYVTPHRGGVWAKRSNWNPAEKLIFSRSMDRLEWLLGTNLPRVRGVDWDELALNRIKLAQNVPNGLPCIVEELRERIRTHLELIHLADIVQDQPPDGEESLECSRDVSAHLSVHTKAPQKPTPIIWLNTIEKCKKARIIWTEVQNLLARQSEFTEAKLVKACENLAAQNKCGRMPVRILLSHALSKGQLRRCLVGNTGRRFKYAYPM